MNLAVRTIAAATLLVVMGNVIRMAHLDRDDTPTDTQGAVTVAMTDTLGVCVIKPVVTKASGSQHGADVAMNVTITRAGSVTLYVYGDGNKGVKSDWKGGPGSFTWNANLPYSTVKGVKDVSGVIDVAGKVTDCVVGH